MRKFTETEYYRNWYAKLEKSELEKVNMEKVLKAWKSRMGTYSDDKLSFENKAILFAQCIHSPQLKSPSQAVYPDFDEFDVKQSENGVWVISGYCDAPNSYGALTRDRFQVYIRCDGENIEYVVSKEKIHNTMIGVAVVLGIIGFGVIGIILL